MIQACFSQPSTPSSKTSHDHHDDLDHDQMPSQNLITCIYQTKVGNSATHVTLTWSKTLHSHTLTIFAPDLFSLTLSLQPSTFSLFRPKPTTSKSVHLTHHRHYRKLKLKLHWDFTRAKFNSAEPDSRFYLALVVDGRVDFFLGDMPAELSQRAGVHFRLGTGAEPSLISRREHVFGRRNNYYASSAVVSGTKHEIGIEYSVNGAGSLKVRVDGELRLVVKRLSWKFRGNEKIFFGGVEVEFFWDVFNWINGDGNGNGNGASHGVFVFQVGEPGGVWPEMVGPEKRLLRKSLSSPTDKTSNNYNVNVGANNNNNNNNNNNCYNSFGSTALTQSPSWSSVLQWAEESSDGGSRSSCASTRSCGSNNNNNNNGGFSLLLYAWRSSKD